MANELIKQNYKNIANAIRSKTGKNGTLTAEAMPTEISAELAKKPTGTKSITANADNIDVAEFAVVNVNVPNPSTGTLDITENNVYDVTSYASVDVEVPNPSSGTLDIYDNDIYDVTDYAEVNVQVSGGGAELQANSVYITNEAGDIYGGPEPVSSSTLYFAGSETPLGTLNMSDGKVAYSDGMGEFETVDVQEMYLYVYDTNGYDSGRFQPFGEIQSESPIYLIYYVSGSTPLMEEVQLAVGEETTVVFENQAAGSYKITRLS